MGKRIAIVGLVAVMLSIGGAVYAQTGELIVLSAGIGGYGRYMFSHSSSWEKGAIFPDAFEDIRTSKTLQYGGPVFLKADIFEVFSLDASLYYLWNTFNSGGDFNNISATFSFFGRIPNHVNSRLTIFPLFGAGYEMWFYAKTEAGNAVKRKDLTDNDTLYLKLGGGLNGDITDRITFNARVVYDILAYNKSVFDTIKRNNTSGLSYFQLRHAPSLFIGASYVFFKL